MLLDKYIEKIRSSSRAWEENPEMRIIWLRTAERIVEDMYDDVIDNMATLVYNMPTYAVVNEAKIADIGDEESYVPNVQPAVLKEDLINAIKKMRDGKSSGVERHG
jgi:hypothetical protein